MGPLSRSLESSLLQLMPELGSVRVSAASPFESPTIPEAVKSILECVEKKEYCEKKYII